jgi:hypothetical protein
MGGWITSATECLINISFYILHFQFYIWATSVVGKKREDYEPRKALKARKEYNEIEKMGRCEDAKMRRCEDGKMGR